MSEKREINPLLFGFLKAIPSAAFYPREKSRFDNGISGDRIYIPGAGFICEVGVWSKSEIPKALMDKSLIFISESSISQAEDMNNYVREKLGLPVVSFKVKHFPLTPQTALGYLDPASEPAGDMQVTISSDYAIRFKRIINVWHSIEYEENLGDLLAIKNSFAADDVGKQLGVNDLKPGPAVADIPKDVLVDIIEVPDQVIPFPLNNSDFVVDEEAAILLPAITEMNRTLLLDNLATHHYQMMA